MTEVKARLLRGPSLELALNPEAVYIPLRV